jgi:hypothetical protein
MKYAELAVSVEAFRREAEDILGFSESSIHRTALLTKSYEKIDSLSVTQADMLRQALRCVEVGVFRAAHVLAWATLTDFLQTMADHDGYAALNAKYPAWALSTIDDLRDTIGEYNLIEGMFRSGMLTKGEKKALHALLNKRNECAHPTEYFPDLNQSLGYVSECISRLEALCRKYPTS